MSIDLDFEMKEGYLYVRVTGVFTLKEALDAFKKTIEAAANYHAARILIDGLEFKGAPDTVERYSFGEYIAEALAKSEKSGNTKRLRVAFVAREPLLDPDHFIMVVASNRGANVWSFDNLPDALKWLLVGALMLSGAI